MEMPAAFASAEDIKRVMRAVRHVERQFNSTQYDGVPEVAGSDPGPPTVFIQIIDAGYEVEPGGFYTGRAKVLNQVTSLLPATPKPWVETDDALALVFTMDGSELEVGDFVPCFVIGVYEEKMVAVTLTIPARDGPCIDVLTNVCEDVYGARTLEYVTVCLPHGSTVSAPFCVAADDDCCPTPVAEPGWYCVAGVCAYYAERPTGGAGPFDTEVACEATGCEDAGEPITNSCCPADPIARTLYATFAGLGTVVLRYNTDGWYDPLAGTGAYPIPECGGTGPTDTACLQFMVKCTNLGLGSFAWRGGFAAELTPVSVQCDPFELVFNFQVFATIGTSPCQSTVYTVTVTE